MILLHIPNQFNLQKYSHSIPHAKPTVTAFSALTRKLKLLPMHLYIRTIFAQCEIFHIGEYFALLTQSIFVYLRDFCSGLKFWVSFSFVKSQHGGCQDKAEITFATPSTTKVSFQRQRRVMKKSDHTREVLIRGPSWPLLPWAFWPSWPLGHHPAAGIAPMFATGNA